MSRIARSRLITAAADAERKCVSERRNFPSQINAFPGRNGGGERPERERGNFLLEILTRAARERGR